MKYFLNLVSLIFLFILLSLCGSKKHFGNNLLELEKYFFENIPNFQIHDGYTDIDYKEVCLHNYVNTLVDEDVKVENLRKILKHKQPDCNVSIATLMESGQLKFRELNLSNNIPPIWLKQCGCSSTKESPARFFVAELIYDADHENYNELDMIGKYFHLIELNKKFYVTGYYEINLEPWTKLKFKSRINVY